MYEVFLGGYSTLKNDHVTFMYAKWAVNVKKMFPLQLCKIFFFRIAWKSTSCKRKNFFTIYGSFCKISICVIWRVMETQLLISTLILHRLSVNAVTLLRQETAAKDHLYKWLN